MKKLLAVLAVLPLACQTTMNTTTETTTAPPRGKLEVLPGVEPRLRQLPKTVIDYDRSLLNENERQVVAKAIVPRAGGTFGVDNAKMREGIRSLATELLMIEATGDYARAQRLLARYGVSTPEIEKVTAQLVDIPVDITPVFPAAGETE